MPTMVALVRGINVAGHRKVAMTDLRALLTDLGFEHPRSLLQSGNLVFDAKGRTAAIERQLEAEAAARLGLQTEFFVRTANEWRDIVAGNPFRQEAVETPSRLVLVALKDEPGATAVRALRAAISGPERFAEAGRHLYVTYPDGYGRTGFTGALIDKLLGTRSTARNWNTVVRVARECGPA